MVIQIEDVLKDLGWSDGFHIPVADEENKQLEIELEKQMRQRASLTSKIEALTDRLEALTNHLRDMSEEHKENQSLITAQRNEIKAMDDAYRVKGGEKLRIEQEIRQTQKAVVETEERNKLMEHELQRHTQRVEELKKLVEWDRDALLAWEEEMARGDDDNTMLIKYAQEDDITMKNLELQRQRTLMDCVKSKDLLDRMINDVRDRELQLEKTAELFRASYRERQSTIQQWEHAVKVLQARDRDIRNLTDEMLALKELLRAKETEKQDVTRTVNELLDTNHRYEAEINEATRKLAKRTDEQKNSSKAVDLLNNELMSVKRTLGQSVREMEGLRKKEKEQAQEEEVLMKRHDALDKRIENLQKKEEGVKEQTLTTAEQSKHLNDLIEAEEKRLAGVMHDVKRLGDAKYRINSKLAELKKKEEALNMQISEVELNRKQQALSHKDLEHQLDKQREYLYTLDYKASTIQAKLDHLAGEVKEPGELEAQEKKISDLEAVLLEKTEALNLLTTQLSRLEEDMRRLSQCLADDQSEVARLQSQRQHQKLMVEGGVKQLKASLLRNQERQVEENVLRLRVEQTASGIKRMGGRVYSLEKQKLELEGAMKERHLEIAAHKDVLKIRKRTLLDEKAKLNMEIAEREHKVSLLQSRFDITMSTLGRDEDGEQFSISKFKIKFLQEKYMLQEEGDALDAKIHGMEKEIRAMENTLLVINATNDTYKKSLSAVDKDDPEYQERSNLESQYFAALDNLRLQRAKLSELNKDIKSMEETLEELCTAEEEMRAALRDKEQALVDADKELSEQQNKLLRADKQLRRLQKEVRANAVDQNVKLMEERDVELREMLEQNLSGLQQLSELVTRHPETQPVVTRYLSEKNLSLPATVSLHSARSSTSSLMRGGGGSSGGRASLGAASTPAVVVPSIVTVDPFSASNTEWSPNVVCGSTASIATRPAAKSRLSRSSLQGKRS